MGIVQGKRALVVGVANDKSLAWSIAQTSGREGAEIALTYQGEILEKRVRPLAAQIEADVIGELDVNDDAQIAAMFGGAQEKVGRARPAGACGRICGARRSARSISDVSRENFTQSLEISAYSLVALARAAEPLMEARGGGSILTLSYLGAVRAIPNYNMMGVAKAALEACVRYLSVDLGGKNIRVNALSAGPARTLSSSAIRDFHYDDRTRSRALAAQARDENRGSRQDGGRRAQRFVERRHRPDDLRRRGLQYRRRVMIAGA